MKRLSLFFLYLTRTEQGLDGKTPPWKKKNSLIEEKHAKASFITFSNDLL
jgi:hypothetical protein